MTMRRILPCVLVLIVLAMSGCGLLGGSDSNSNSTNLNANVPSRPNANTTASPQRSLTTINWKLATENVQNALDKISSDRRPPFTAKQVSDDLTKALKELGKDDVEVRDRCDKCDDDTINAAQNAHESIKSVVKILQPLANTPISSETKVQITELLDRAKSNLQKATKGSTPLATPTPSETATPTPDSVGKEREKTEGYGFMDWVIRGLAIAGGLLVLVLTGMGIVHLRKQSRQHLEHHLGKVAAVNASVTREAHKEILDKLSSLSSAQTDTSTRLHDVHTEIRTLARLVRESSSSSRGDGHSRSYASLASSYVQNDPPPLKEEPEFPVSAVDYLDKMTRFINVVKPDFQNGILVNDPDGTGELVVIRDSRQLDDTRPLFLVPRHPQFQTKQDFYTYYEKYYECAKPSAGDVWIIGPAVVEKVSGGWELREKGLLEVRQ